MGKIALPSGHLLPGMGGRMRGEPIYAPELPASTGTANTILVPAEIRTGDDQTIQRELHHPLTINADYIPTKYIMYRGKMLFIGDHVAIKGDDEQIYFAVLYDFWHTSTGEKWCKLQWLLPKKRFAMEIDGPKELIDPAYFALGPLHDKEERLEVIVDIFFSPQQLRRSLEGPTLPSIDTEASGLSTPSERRSSLSDKVELITPPPSRQAMRKNVMSDSELELNRISTLKECKQQIKSKMVASNILDDVEMAHLLCSMS